MMLFFSLVCRFCADSAGVSRSAPGGITTTHSIPVRLLRGVDSDSSFTINGAAVQFRLSFRVRGVYLKDLTFIEDGNPDKVRGLINFAKRRMLYNTIQEVLLYQVQEKPCFNNFTLLYAA
jgi:hypothetical protein